ncbi:hypothetical protein SAMN06269185_2766 [Natronoarchaeum philippinense]|uniref:Membrane domain of glycerophosphoryl diester phosphodiesterase n=1 Tax=Natronoarchaeum philippinense TaxID=558529 RepID=A0A285P8Y3_NATPI|nr:hypothetical protein [Natronoarchaeum philippinense]SNZ16341.1 hypothetical protein SAMN06269185_2766 [Natronoarchaeum philippinense]
MSEFSDRLGTGVASLRDLVPLAALPVVLSVLDFDAIRNVLAFDGVHVGLKFGIPVPIVDLWSVVDPPNAGVTGGTTYQWEAGTTDLLAVAGGGGSALVAAIGFAFVGFLVEGMLAAGYLGSVHEYLTTGQYGFVANVRRYAVPIVGLYLLGLAAFLAAVPVLLVAPPLIIPGAIVFLAAIFLLWATPYLIVVRDCSLREGLVRSYRLAAAGGPHFRFTLTYLLAVLALSFPASLVVANAGAVGLLVGLAAIGPLGLTLNVAVMDFVLDLAGPQRRPTA